MHARRRWMFLAMLGVLLWANRGTAQTVARDTDDAPAMPADGVRAGQQPGQRLGRPSVDPTLDLLRRVSRRQLPSRSIFRTPKGDFPASFDARGARVSIRFEAVPAASRLAALEQLGVRFERDAAGAARHLGAVFVAWMPWRALDTLAAHRDIARIEALWQPMLSGPLEVTSELVGAAQARLRPDFEADGAGTTIALIDTGIDVLHPFFFRADGGYYPWLDVNEDGVFDPGIDAVDLDGDGRASHNEVLRVLDATDVVDFADRAVENEDGVLQPARDWLYADMNGDRQRNVGVDAGFNESTPAYGEAVFVVDDADRDGVLDPDEKLVRLQTSKIERYETPLGVFVRGENLIESSRGGAQAALHGSGSAGILVGGQPGFHERVGVAPRARLVVYGLGEELVGDTALPLDYLEQAADAGADVVLHEWTNAFTMPLDGSTNFEAAMSAARQAGVVQVNPLGNLNIADKHTAQTAGAGETLHLGFHVGAGYEQDGEVLPYSSAFGSLQCRGEEALSVAIEAPSGARVELGAQDDSAQLDGVQIDLTRELTDRGTTVVGFYLEATDPQAALAEGVWTIEVGGLTGPDTVYGRITDAYSNWHPGIGWEQPSADRTTLAFPSTADAAVGVAAFAGRQPTPIEGGAEVGELRTFSGRGPRIDGVPAADLAAPDDPFVPLGVTPRILQADWGRSWFARFGGTSGAAPHVAASVALLRQKHPSWSTDQLEQRLFDTADAQGLSPAVAELPDPGWGFGKLDIYRALFDAEPAPNAAPEAVLEATMDAGAAVWDASASTDPDGDALEYRFDVGYDGVWETDWTDEPIFEADGQVVRLEVRDPRGGRDGAIARLEGGGAGGGVDAAEPAEGADAGDAADSVEPNPTDSCCATAPGRAPGLPLHLLVALAAGLLFHRRRSV